MAKRTGDRWQKPGESAIELKYSIPQLVSKAFPGITDKNTYDSSWDSWESSKHPESEIMQKLEELSSSQQQLAASFAAMQSQSQRSSVSTVAR